MFFTQLSLAALIAGFAPCGVYAQDIAQAPSPHPSDVARDTKWVVNFKDLDIRSVIQQIGAITGENYIVPPNVSGKVNVVSQAPLDRNELKELLLSTLYINGYAVTSSSAGLIIQPTAEAKKNTPLVLHGAAGGGGEFVVRVLPVKYASPNELMLAVQPMVSDFAVLKSLQDSNALLIADKADNVQNIAEIISELDYPETNEMETIKLTNSWVRDIMPLLEKLAPRELGASGRGAFSTIRLVADENRNMIIVKGDIATRHRIRALITRLDEPIDQSSPVQVIMLQNSDAVKMADILKDMFGAPAGAAPSAPAGAPPGTPPILAGLSSGSVSIKASVASNALVVHAPPDVIATVRKVVAQLDVPRTQVLIEAAIVEISDDLLNQLGIQFGAGQSAFSSDLLATSLSPPGSSSLAAPVSGLGSYLQQINATTSSNTLIGGGITAVIGSRNQFAVFIQALSADSRANMLSTPSITTVNNEEAKIVVGQNVPFRTGSFDTASNGVVNPFTTIQRQDVGLTLKVTPQINENNHVMLKVSQEVSSIQPTNISGAADIITNKRSIDTTIIAINGQTVALGGLISNNSSESQSKVPFLGDIPFLGALFRSTQNEKNKTDLVVFLRPTVLENGKEIENVNLRRYNGLWEMEIGNTAPLLPWKTVKPQIDKFFAPNLPPARPVPLQADGAKTPDPGLPWLHVESHDVPPQWPKAIK